MRLVRALALIGLLAAASPSLSAEGPDRLLLDLVRIKEGRFVYDQISICQLKYPGRTTSKFQLRSHAEAPTEGPVSRDNFVALVTQIETQIALGMADNWPGITPSRALQVLDCDPLTEPIGTVDVEIKTIMTWDGLQIQITNTASGEVNRSSLTWKEMFD